MGNNDISKFNGQYLKCIVTKHKGTMNALSDKGALIIYQKNDRNYAYLGNEFIASGYGFDSLEKLSGIEKIIDTYDNNIDNINNSLNDINDNINDINDNINKTINDIFNNYDPKIYVKNGKTTLLYNLNDIFFRGQNATYKDFEFTTIRKKIIINNSNSPLKINNKDYFVGNEVIELPIGTKINQVIYEFEYNKNDTEGFKTLYINYFKTYEDFKENKISEHKYEERQLNVTTANGSFTITFNFNKDPFYVTGSDEITVINSISGNIKGTSENQYKYYPRFNDYNILSTENIIDDHYHVFDDKLCIKPISYLRYRFNEFNINENGEFSDDVENRINELDLSYICDNIMINPTNGTGEFYAFANKLQFDNPKTKDIQSIVYINKTTKGNIFYVNIPVENINLNVFTFFIPYSFKVHRLLYVTENSEYNLTGAVGCIENCELFNGSIMPIYIRGPLETAYTGDKFYYMKTRIYQFTINNGHFNKEGFFKLELMCINENFENDIDINEIYKNENGDIIHPLLRNYLSNSIFSDIYGNDYQIGRCTKWNILNNEEFNRIYWLSFNDIPNEHSKAIDSLKNKLEFVNERIIE